MNSIQDLHLIPRRDLPALNERNTFFWQSGKNGKLRFSRCQDCRHYIHPSSPACPKCLSRNVKPEVVSGKAVVASFTINRQVWAQGLDAPYVVAIVEMAEQTGLRVTTNVVGCSPEQVYVGMKVRVVFDHREDVWLPLFAPDEDL